MKINLCYGSDKLSIMIITIILNSTAEWSYKEKLKRLNIQKLVNCNDVLFEFFLRKCPLSLEKIVKFLSSKIWLLFKF